MFAEIPLNQLTLSAANVRKTAADDAANIELAASILAHGLLEPLLVQETAEQYVVIAGGRRLATLQALAANGDIADDHLVSCKLMDVETADAIEISLAENTQRTAMHPIDEYEAFAQLIDEGASLNDIAIRFGKSERAVTQRLSLGRLHKDLRQLCRESKLSLNALSAYTLEVNPDTQLDIYTNLSEWRKSSPHAIRSAIKGSAISSQSQIGRFIDLETYTKQGGTITEDLFSEDGELLLNDPTLANRLAMEKLQTIAETYKADGWKWVTFDLEIDYDKIGKCRHLGIETREPSDEERRTFNELNAEIKDAEDRIYEDDDDSCDAQNRLTELQDELESLEDTLKFWSAETKAKSGVYVYLGSNDSHHAYEGLVLPEDAVKEIETGDSPSGSTFSQALKDDLVREQLAVLQHELAGNFDCAFDLMLYTLVSQVCNYGSPWSDPLDVSVTSTIKQKDTDQLLIFNNRPEGSLDYLEEDWNEDDTKSSLYFEILKWDQAKKQRVFAWCVARTLRSRPYSGDSKAIYDDLLDTHIPVRIADHWRPTAQNFWSRVSKDKALEIAEEVLGYEWVKANRDFKKKELAAQLEAIFSGEPCIGVTLDQSERAARWLPETMMQEDASHLDTPLAA